MRRTAPFVWVALIAVILAGCHSEPDAPHGPRIDGTALERHLPKGGPEAARDLPACTEVWVEGRTLPEDYNGCLKDSRTLSTPVYLACSGGSRLMASPDEKWFALAGGRIASSAGWEEAALACITPE